MTHRVVVVGSGPAGYTAALYTARANLRPRVFAGANHGGQLMTTTDVENYPGFPEGILGPDLMENFRKQAERFEADIVFEDVTAVDLSSRPYKITTRLGVEEAHSVIIATGASAKLLGLEAETRLMGRGVSTCATCDGFFFREQEIVVVGGGDSAMEEANFLTRFASKVYLVHRREGLRASAVMVDRARANEKIEWRLNTVVDTVIGEEKVEGIKLKNTVDGSIEEIPATGMFVAIGHTPNSHLFEGQLELHDNGYIKTFEGARTSVEGVFACGDVQDFTYRQAITASGSGCMAAIDAERWLEHEGVEAAT